MKILWKDFLRSIGLSLGRFLAIAGICALGVGFYGALRMSGGDMRLSLNDYYNQTNMMDIRIVSTLGLSDENINAFKQVDGVEGVMPAYETDILTDIDNDTCVVKVHSLNSSAYDSNCINNFIANSNNDDYLNRPALVKGAWPHASDECVISNTAVMSKKLEIGDEVIINECSTGIDSTLTVNKFKITGFVNSSYYVCSTNFGTTTIGNGQVQEFIYVPNSAFSDDFPYSEAFIKVKNSEKFVNASEEYQKCIDDVMLNLSKLAPEQSEIRSASVKSKAQDKLDEGRIEFNKQKINVEKELDNNQKKLNDSYEQIISGEKQLKDTENYILNGFNEFYTQKNNTLTAISQGFSTINSLIDTNNAFSRNYSSLCTTLDSQYAEAINLSNTWENRINLLTQVCSTADALKGVCSASSQFVDAVIVDENEKQLARFMFENYSSTLTSFEDKIKVLIDALNSASMEEDRQAAWTINIENCNILYNTLIPSQTTISSFYTTVSSNLNSKFLELQYQENLANEKFNAIEEQLIEGAKQMQEGKDQLESGKAEYYEGLKKFNEAKVLAEQELSSAEQQINDSQKEIDNIENAEFYIMDRTKNYGAINFDNDAERIDNIAQVFPLIFFLVAALVVLTSVTRMIDEERTSIGTHKALGFSRWKISFKFLGYGIFACLGGSIVGLLIIPQVIPYVILTAYGIMYQLPFGIPMPFDFGYAILSAGMGLLITLCATIFAAGRTLKEVPAILMIPSAPKAGKRILFEYIKPIWNILNFNWKVTFRNMFLYKKRFFMAIIGIAGCTALLITGFGLSDSINDIINKQFNEIIFDNFNATYKSQITSEQKNSINSTFDKWGISDDVVEVRDENFVAQPEGHPDAIVSVLVPDNVEIFSDLRILRTRNNHNSIKLNDDGVVVSEKLATLMHVKAGDTIVVNDQDKIGNAGPNKYELKISDITENYVAHYVYMTKNFYEKTMNKNCVLNSFVCRFDGNQADKENFSKEISKFDFINTSTFTDKSKESYQTMLSSVDMVVVVLILAAAILAFVVLYNLININICERSREIATLKVLGSTSFEVNMYIHRETFILSIIGSIVGVFLGFVLENFVIVSSEVDYCMFGREVYPASILISVGITLIFTILVAILLRKKLYSISMVESLKSID